MPQASSGKPLRFWLLLIGLIALACVAGLVALSLHRQSGAMVQITQDGQVVGTYSLQQPRTLRYESHCRRQGAGLRGQLPGPGLCPHRSHRPNRFPHRLPSQPPGHPGH